MAVPPEIARPDRAPLEGRVVVTTRDQPGRLDRMLAEAGATVLHVPLIAIEPIDDVVVPLDGATWLIATSQHGAAAVGGRARAHPEVKLAAVGTRTAEVLAEFAGRPVDLVPERQTAADLVAAFPAGTGRVVAAVGDLSPGVPGLERRGWTVDTYVVYRTRLQSPDPDVRAVLLGSDAVTFASGSAARAWADAIGTATPPVVVVIGPTTEAVARQRGLPVTHVAATFDLDGLVAAVAEALA